jgi:high affinity Mn2+ porin
MMTTSGGPLLALAGLLVATSAAGAAPAPRERLSLHYQATTSTQAHPDFHAPYSGANSLNAEAEAATALVMNLAADAKLWPGGELLLNPELSGGKGISRTVGVAAFPSGIVYRVGDPSPTVYLARLVVRQSIGLGGGRLEAPGGANLLAGTHDRDELTISAGRLALTDVFDANAYAHDPTTQFFNWALFASGAWDYPADTRGYTWGVLSDLRVADWSLRMGVALLPKTANGLDMEWNLTRSHALIVEGERRYSLAGRRGSARVLVFVNDAPMGSYEQAVNDPAANLEVAATRVRGRTKSGFAANADQELASGLGAFVRVSYNDGNNETWAFTEIDRSLALGLVKNGAPWSRPDDDFGVAVVIDGLSMPHRNYLASGGYGFILGDGQLDYGAEVVGDVYYRAQLTREMALSGVYQPIVNPGYNRDRGPVHVFSTRFRVAF